LNTNNKLDTLRVQKDWTKNNLKYQVYELFRSKNVKIRLVSNIQFMLVYHVDFRKQLEKNIKECLIFIVGHLPEAVGTIQYDYLNTIQTLIIQESLIMSSHLMFFANTHESIQKKFQMSLEKFVFKDINVLKDILRSDANRHLMNLLSEQLPSNVISPFKYLGPCSPDMFVGHEILISEIIEGNHSGHAITGGRRIGKTSLLLKILDEIAKGRTGKFYNKDTGRLENQAYECCYIDCINIYMFQTVYNEIYRKLSPKLFYPKKHSANPIRDIRDIVSRTCALRNKKLLLLFDGMDDLMAMASANDKDAIEFAKNLQAAANDGLIKFVISGFRNISELIVNARHPFYNLCKGTYMGVLNKNDVRKMIVKATFNENFRIRVDDINSIVEEIYMATGGYPSVIQFVADQLLKGNNNFITSENVYNVMNSNETKNYVLETVMMNTNPFERLICIIAAQMDHITNETIIDCIVYKHDIRINDIDRKVFSALKNLCYNCILLDKGEQYFFLYPLLPVIVRKYLINSIPRLKMAILS